MKKLDHYWRTNPDWWHWYEKTTPVPGRWFSYARKEGAVVVVGAYLIGAGLGVMLGMAIQAYRQERKQGKSM